MNPYLRYGIPTLGGAVVGGAGAAQDGGDFGNVLGGALLGAGIGAGAMGAASTGWQDTGKISDRIAGKVSGAAKKGKVSGQDFLAKHMDRIKQDYAKNPSYGNVDEDSMRMAILKSGGNIGRNILNPLAATTGGSVVSVGSTALGMGAMLPAGAVAGGVASMLSPIDPESYGSSNLPQTRANSLYQMTSNLNR